VKSLFAGLARAHPGVLLEDKLYALALHYRLAPEAKSALTAALRENDDLLKTEGVTLVEGKAVIDARPSGIDKGVGLSTLIGQQPFAGRPVLFGGDDTTDLDVFRILPGIGGHGFSVGKHFPGVEHVFASPRAVRQWLTRLADQGMAA
jgi:trehalose 6-phosphate phosphatase